MSSIKFELYKPTAQHPHSDGHPVPWLQEIRAMRSQVLYASGRRPHFGPNGHRFGDPCPLDHHSFHVTARVGTKIIGCIRGLPLSKTNDGVLDQVMGGGKLDHSLTALQIEREHCLEVSRLILDAEFRASQIARHMVASIWAVSWHHRLRMIVAGLGTRDYQDRFIARLGGKAMPHTEPMPVHAYDDHIRPMYAWAHAPGIGIANMVREMHDHFFGKMQIVPPLAAAV